MKAIQKRIAKIEVQFGKRKKIAEAAVAALCSHSDAQLIEKAGLLDWQPFVNFVLAAETVLAKAVNR